MGKLETVRVAITDPESRDTITTRYDSMGEVSDGYHTFDELYHHRMALTAALCKLMPDKAWRSLKHAENGDPMFEGFFVVGIDLPEGQISYHYKLEEWPLFDHVNTLENAPVWDGHTPADVVGRLESFAVSGS